MTWLYNSLIGTTFMLKFTKLCFSSLNFPDPIFYKVVKVKKNRYSVFIIFQNLPFQLFKNEFMFSKLSWLCLILLLNFQTNINKQKLFLNQDDLWYLINSRFLVLMFTLSQLYYKSWQSFAKIKNICALNGTQIISFITRYNSSNSSNTMFLWFIHVFSRLPTIRLFVS